MDENKTNNSKKSGRKLGCLILVAVIILVIVLLVSCISGGCKGKKGPNNSTNGTASLDSAVSLTSHYTDSYYSGSGTSNTGTLNLEVASGSPEKRTVIYGNGEDVATVMVYVCGSDLESESGAATMDISEMLDANVGENVNLILYTGGTTDWQNRQMSSNVNQIYQISDGKLYLLEDNAGDKNMTDSDTLSEFIRFCNTNFPANRNMLILWDHGGGSVAGYGSDEKYQYGGTMDLGKLRKALRDGGVNFDFFGFDACLMGTLETGLALSDYSDYLIASEEIESGYGWYYTNWLSSLSKDTSIPTVELGREIADDFIRASTQAGEGWSGTQSVVDLCELSYTVPEKLEAFASATTDLIESEGDDGDYKTVTRARSDARSFGQSVGVDQVDLVDFARHLETAEGMALAKAVQDSVKYNNTTRDMTNAYGLSIYFPYTSPAYVSTAEQIYDQIGLTSEYTRCIEAYAAMELSGQYISGGSGNPFNSLYGIFGSGDYGDSYYYGNSSGESYSSSDIMDLLGELLEGSMGGFSSDYEDSDFDFFRSKNVNLEAVANYLAKNQFDERNLEWKKSADGNYVISMPENQWDLIQSIELNMFVDDGEGLVDLGSDNIFDFDEEGNLIGTTDNGWLSIDGHIISYYYDSMTMNDDHYLITGYSQIVYNGKDADLILYFDQDRPYGYIGGVRFLEETDTPNVGKTVEGVVSGNKADFDSSEKIKIDSVIKEGDKIEFVADFYDYKGNFKDSYVIGDPWIVGSKAPEIANIDLGEDKAVAMYCLTDIYHKQYWTGVIPN
ncbi:MAG: peptidase C11 [Parasporobacterium sp.]|nr:peptidase C11 [Parasporobacterium sp.]